MTRRLTTEEFIENAKAKHGDRYDYSQVEYVDAKAEVKIICEEHGIFQKTPNAHLRKKSGCGECAKILRANKQRLTTEEFIEKAKKVHGEDHYDYSEVEYVRASDKVRIICPEHGRFSQTPNAHLAGKVGCDECKPNTPLQEKEFVTLASRKKLTWLSKKLSLKATDVKHDWRCLTCGYEWSSTYESVKVSKHSCPRCAGNARLSESDYLAVAMERGFKWRGPSLPRNSQTKTAWECEKGHRWEAHISNIKSGRGCPSCAGKNTTTQSFILKAKTIHDDGYDYSQAEYVSAHSKVAIICPNHGPFSQSPANHLSGQGCPICAGNTPTTAVKFKENARSIHGDRYDYSQIVYINNKTPVTIICPEHGPFQQSPTSHLSGQGCPDCGGTKRLTTETFIEKVKSIHGDRFDYSLVEYVNNITPVSIICFDHGPFQQTPLKHTTGQGCPDCGGRKQLTTETFIEKANAIHEDRYDYSLVEYVRNSTPVTILCSDHGPFQQTPMNHLSGNRCPECAGVKPLNTESFRERANAIHGDRYDYSQAVYVNNRTPVTIICPDHGPFSQAPNNHFAGQDCPDCATSGFNPNDRATLYYLAIKTDDGGTRYKVGITNRTVKERFNVPDLARIRIVKEWHYGMGRDAAEREAEILRLYAGERYYGPEILQSGNTELFTHDILELDQKVEKEG